MNEKILKPKNIYAPTPDYAHGIEISDGKRVVYTAGTMGLEIDGSVPAGIDRQLELLWENNASILAAADMTVDNIVRLTSYLSDRKYSDKNTKARMTALGRRVIPTTAIICDLYDEAWLVEIEVIAMS